MIIRIATLVALALLALAPAATAQEQPRMGGVLKAGMIGEPPTLDLHVTTAVITQQITWHVYETLYTYDKTMSPIPMLAEGHAVADNGRRYTITLRKGVRFHNGKEMTSADVVPSLQHWGKLATPGKAIWKNVEAIEAKGPYSVVIYLKEPSGSLLFALGSPNNGAAIYPKDILAAAGDLPVKGYIGTGPYRFIEHKPDRHVRLARFKEYSARSEPPNGYGGKRTAYIDEIYFIPVPEASVRLAGAETGEYNFAQSIRQDQVDRVKGQPALEAQIVKPYGWITAVPNHKEGIMANRKVRQALLAVLDMEPIMSAGIGNKAFYRLDGALFYPEQGLFHSQAGVTG
ncbi:MAG: ABC transporter substrate-binding protein, partial [Candidatus Rokubacteria bacterium]|nr:ABC transporter substrate-binding protein [Candidatus Rokubacteria bacterium]